MYYYTCTLKRGLGGIMSLSEQNNDTKCMATRRRPPISSQAQGAVIDDQGHMDQWSLSRLQPKQFAVIINLEIFTRLTAPTSSRGREPTQPAELEPKTPSTTPVKVQRIVIEEPHTNHHLVAISISEGGSPTSYIGSRVLNTYKH